VPGGQYQAAAGDGSASAAPAASAGTAAVRMSARRNGDRVGADDCMCTSGIGGDTATVRASVLTTTRSGSGRRRVVNGGE
jgi:hypothetical protein